MRFRQSVFMALVVFAMFSPVHFMAFADAGVTENASRTAAVIANTFIEEPP